MSSSIRASGIDKDLNIVPSSQRADGSIRRALKVRPGFTPEEDVQKYRPPGWRVGADKTKSGSHSTESCSKDMHELKSALSSMTMQNDRRDLNQKRYLQGRTQKIVDHSTKGRSQSDVDQPESDLKRRPSSPSQLKQHQDGRTPSNKNKAAESRRVTHPENVDEKEAKAEKHAPNVDNERDEIQRSESVDDVDNVDALLRKLSLPGESRWAK